MKIAIVGGTGFVGQHLLQLLAKTDHKILALSRNEKPTSKYKNVEWIQGDLQDKEALKNLVSGCTVVCNCAGETSDPEKFITVNYNGTKNLYQASQNAKVELFIQLSSTGVYGRQLEGTIDESSPMIPMNPYEDSKIQADKWLFLQNGPQIAILRPTNIYGQNMPNNSLRQLVSVLSRRLFFFIGSRNAITSYIHVENVVRAIIRTIESKHKLTSNEAFNLSDDILLIDFIKIISDSMNLPTPKFRLPKSFCLALLFVNEKLLNFKLPLSFSRVHFLSKCSTYSFNKFMHTFSWKHPAPHSESLPNYVRTILIDLD